MDGLSKEEFLIVRNLLSAARQTPGDKKAVEEDDKDLKDCINAIHIAGYVIVPRGMIESMRAVINRLK